MTQTSLYVLGKGLDLGSNGGHGFAVARVWDALSASSCRAGDKLDDKDIGACLAATGNRESTGNREGFFPHKKVRHGSGWPG